MFGFLEYLKCLDFLEYCVFFKLRLVWCGFCFNVWKFCDFRTCIVWRFWDVVEYLEALELLDLHGVELFWIFCGNVGNVWILLLFCGSAWCGILGFFEYLELLDFLD